MHVFIFLKSLVYSRRFLIFLFEPQILAYGNLNRGTECTHSGISHDFPLLPYFVFIFILAL